MAKVKANVKARPGPGDFQIGKPGPARPSLLRF